VSGPNPIIGQADDDRSSMDERRARRATSPRQISLLSTPSLMTSGQQCNTASELSSPV